MVVSNSGPPTTSHSCCCGWLSQILIGINCCRQSSPKIWLRSWSLATLVIISDNQCDTVWGHSMSHRKWKIGRISCTGPQRIVPFPVRHPMSPHGTKIDENFSNAQFDRFNASRQFLETLLVCASTLAFSWDACTMYRITIEPNNFTKLSILTQILILKVPLEATVVSEGNTSFTNWNKPRLGYVHASSLFLASAT